MATAATEAAARAKATAASCRPLWQASASTLWWTPMATVAASRESPPPPPTTTPPPLSLVLPLPLPLLLPPLLLPLPLSLSLPLSPSPSICPVSSVGWDCRGDAMGWNSWKKQRMVTATAKATAATRT